MNIKNLYNLARSWTIVLSTIILKKITKVIYVAALFVKLQMFRSVFMNGNIILEKLLFRRHVSGLRYVLTIMIRMIYGKINGTM